MMDHSDLYNAAGDAENRGATPRKASRSRGRSLQARDRNQSAEATAPGKQQQFEKREVRREGGRRDRAPRRSRESASTASDRAPRLSLADADVDDLMKALAERGVTVTPDPNAWMQASVMGLENKAAKAAKARRSMPSQLSQLSQPLQPSHSEDRGVERGREERARQGERGHQRDWGERAAQGGARRRAPTQEEVEDKGDALAQLAELGLATEPSTGDTASVASVAASVGQQPPAAAALAAALGRGGRRLQSSSAASSSSEAEAAHSKEASLRSLRGRVQGGGTVSETTTGPRWAGGVEDATFKVLVVGNPRCGKTSLIGRFATGRFNESYKATIGADFVRKEMPWDGADVGRVKLQLWDIAGQDRFIHLTRSYFSKAMGAVIVCDVTREGTFESAQKWKAEIDRVLQEENPDALPIPVVLLANKSDLLIDTTTSFVAGAQMEQTCSRHNMAGWYVTSAKTDDNVDEAMHFLVDKMVDVRAKNQAREAASFPRLGGRGRNNSISLREKPAKKKSSSCC